ncbi:MAG TPA: hypothetical protein VKB46_15370 [Pyrinomonadaceae bacterium]|nr:hypothetical protein [Pyrinomonadaceae bacterium]
MLDNNKATDDPAFKRRFKLALFGFAIVEFLVTAFVVIYKFKH